MFLNGSLGAKRKAGFSQTETRVREIGGAKRDRTADLLTASQALSQLSYSPKRKAEC